MIVNTTQCHYHLPLWYTVTVLTTPLTHFPCKLISTENTSGYLTCHDVPLTFGVFAGLAGEMHPFLTVTILYITPALCGVYPVTCILQGDPHPPALFKDGDFIIGGVFSIHDYLKAEKHTFTRWPLPLECTGRLAYARWWNRTLYMN